jgi:EmrB/QacA subfamily drug resistance transporter
MAASTSQRSTLVAAAVASGITSLPTTALGVALPTLHSEFQANVNELQWTLTAYSLAYAALLITAGRFGDMLGHRRLLLWGAAVFGVGSIAGAAAQSPLWLICSLAAIGVGGAMLVPASLAVVTTAFAGHARERGIGVWGAASGLISGLGPPIGGVLTEHVSWRAIFGAQALAAIVILVITRLEVAESRSKGPDDELDIRGFVCLAGGIGLLALPLIEASGWGWTGLPTLISFATAGLLLAGFFAVERRARNPVFELGLFRHRNFTAGVLLKLAMNFVLAGLFFLLPIYMQEVLHYSPMESGLLLLPLSVTFLLGLPVGGRLLDRIGPRPPMLIGLALMAFGVYFLSDLRTASDWALWPPLLVLGFGLGLILTPVNAAALEAVPTARHGEAAGILSTTIAMGSVFGVALTGAVFKEFQDGRLEKVLRPDGFTEMEERRLEGVLAHSPPADHYLHSLNVNYQDTVLDGLHASFRYGVETAVRLSAGLLVLVFVLTAVIVRKVRGRVPDATALTS